MSNTVNNRNEWIFGAFPPCGQTKEQIYTQNMTQMLQKTLRMFKWSNLPDTIPVKDLELILQIHGSATIGKDDHGNLYAFRGGLGGEPNPYYLPTISVVANPALRLNKTYHINDDCVVILNDNLYRGMLPLFSKYASLMTEAELTLRQALINHRVPAAIQADNDKAAKSAELLLKQVAQGDQFGVIGSTEFFDGCKTLPFNNGQSQSITQSIEAIQYLYGTWLQEIGVNAPFNMKREALNSAETALNDDVLLPFTDTMLECRREAAERINAMFGTDITVDFSGVWKQNREYLQAELEAEEKGGENDDQETPDGDGDPGTV